MKPRTKKVSSLPFKANDKRKRGDTQKYIISIQYQDSFVLLVEMNFTRSVAYMREKWSAISFDSRKKRHFLCRLYYYYCSSTHVTGSWINRLCICVSCIFYIVLFVCVYIFRFAIYLVLCCNCGRCLFFVFVHLFFFSFSSLFFRSFFCLRIHIILICKR